MSATSRFARRLAAASFILSFCFCFSLPCLTKPYEARTAKQGLDQTTLTWMQSVLDNWERVCRRDLHTYLEPLPWIIFYDDTQALHLMPEERLLPPHPVTSSSLIFVGRKIKLVRVANQNGKLWVPDRAPLDATRPQAVAMPYNYDRKVFFIAPLPALYRRLASADQAPALDELFLGTTAHELTHTRQLAYAAQQISRLQSRYKLPASIDDNIIEREFKANEEYRKLFAEEHKLLPDAVMTNDLAECRRKVKQILQLAQRRKERFFVGEKAGYGRLEDIFLTMEGIAMWVQYRTALERAPQGEDQMTTLTRLMKATDAWSQEEGLGLFLLINRLVPNWQKRFLAPDLPSPFAVLSEMIETGTG